MTEPALTEEEWTEWLTHGIVGRGIGAVDGFVVTTRGVGFLGLKRIDIERTPHPCDTECHGLAALLLYSQPFGFTREDVQLIRDVEALNDSDMYSLSAERLAAYKSLADRLESLLPPER